MKKVDVDSGQILIIKKELVENFTDNKCENKDEKEGQTKVADGIYCVDTAYGDGTFYFEVNPSNTEVYEDFIGFTTDSTGFSYTVYNKWYSEEDEGCVEYLQFDQTTGTIKIEEAGEYVIADPCSLTNDSPTVFLEAKEYDICFFENVEE
jgi:hypothetical protein